MSIKNRGQSAAYSVTYWWDSDVLPVSTAPQRVGLVEIRETGQISSDIDPTGEWPIEQAAKPISPEDLRAVRDSVKSIYVWGIVKYRDVFMRCHYVRRIDVVKFGSNRQNQK
jgi:hypothetical protein